MVIMSHTVNCPIDCNSNRLTGRPANNILKRIARRRVRPFSRKPEKVTSQMIVNSNANGRISINDGNCVGSVVTKRINRAKEQMPIVTETFFFIYCVL